MVRGRKWPRITVSSVDDHVRDDALEEARIDLIDWVSGIEALAERVFACAAVSAFDSHLRSLDLLNHTSDNSIVQPSSMVARYPRRGGDTVTVRIDERHMRIIVGLDA